MLSQNEERNVRELNEQIKELPQNIRQQHPEGGVEVEVAISATVIRMGDYIKADEALLHVLPDILRLIEDANSTLGTIREAVQSRFDEVLFQIE